uniref:SFRICE_010502 n=1 Tax=Spodoptera frugiperda TaxID=7108 RepID=A0A2H1WD80_SPOFR
MPRALSLPNVRLSIKLKSLTANRKLLKANPPLASVTGNPHGVNSNEPGALAKELEGVSVVTVAVFKDQYSTSMAELDIRDKSAGSVKFLGHQCARCRRLHVATDLTSETATNTTNFDNDSKIINKYIFDSINCRKKTFEGKSSAKHQSPVTDVAVKLTTSINTFTTYSLSWMPKDLAIAICDKSIHCDESYTSRPLSTGTTTHENNQVGTAFLYYVMMLVRLAQWLGSRLLCNVSQVRFLRRPVIMVAYHDIIDINRIHFSAMRGGKHKCTKDFPRQRRDIVRKPRFTPHLRHRSLKKFSPRYVFGKRCSSRTDVEDEL